MAEKKKAAPPKPVVRIVDPAERDKVLKSAISQLEKKYGEGTVMFMGENRRMDIESISTGSLMLDLALGIGGLPRGRIVEIYGTESSGKTTISLQAIAEAQKAGGMAAFIDVEHALDPIYAKKLGVDIDNLLVSQPDTGEQALEIIETLVRSGAIDIIVLDSVAAMTTKAEIDGDMGDAHVGVQARLMSQAMRKLTAVISNTNTVAIFINQIREKIGVMYGNPETTPGGRALKFYSSVRIEVRRGEPIKDGGEIIGNRTKCKVVKNKVSPPFKIAEFDMLYGQGVSKMGEIVDTAVDFDIVKKSGSWFSYNDMKIGQGREKVLDYLKNNPDICNEIEQKIRDEVSKNASLLDSLEDKSEEGAEGEDGVEIAETDDGSSEKPAKGKKKSDETSDEDDFAEFSPEDIE
ncbi:MAG: recombinase RecA [Oscillospiraceae bacterium]|nr:recombinase RecA [Oscillospiraceae bacterium]